MDKATNVRSISERRAKDVCAKPTFLRSAPALPKALFPKTRAMKTAKHAESPRDPSIWPAAHAERKVVA